MRQRYRTARLEPNALFVDDGTIITSAGTAAGIDASLHLVRRELGTAIATKIARRMVVPPQRDGGQQQFVDLPIPVCATDSLTPVLTWVVEHLDQQHTASSLARRAMMSDRTFARRFVAETGTTPHQWVTQQRILAARSLLEESDLVSSRSRPAWASTPPWYCASTSDEGSGLRRRHTGSGSAPSR